MSWMIRIGNRRFERGMNLGITASSQCRVTSTSCHTVAELFFAPGTDKELASSKANDQATPIWQHILATLTELD